MSNEEEKTYKRPTQIVHYGVAEISKPEEIEDMETELESNPAETAANSLGARLELRTGSPSTNGTYFILLRPLLLQCFGFR